MATQQIECVRCKSTDVYSHQHFVRIGKYKKEFLAKKRKCNTCGKQWNEVDFDGK